MLSIISQFVEVWANVFGNCELSFPASSRDTITFLKDKTDHGGYHHFTFLKDKTDHGVSK